MKELSQSFTKVMIMNQKLSKLKIKWTIATKKKKKKKIDLKKKIKKILNFNNFNKIHDLVDLINSLVLLINSEVF